MSKAPEADTAAPDADKEAARTEGGNGKAATPRAKRGRVRRLADGGPLRTVALALAFAALCSAVWAGLSWYGAAHDDTLEYAATRDEVRSAGEQAVQNLNTLDHRKVDAGLDSWEESTTGELRGQLKKGRKEFEKQIRAAKTVTSARILSSAVAELDERAGRAGVLVAVRTTVKAPKEKPATKQTRMRGELTRTEDGWKLSALAQVPVGYSATAPDERG
ncbi:nuclear transport factor 2 family protein [Streptomyces diacarni]|uniref:nuclear transport factor 2 family protein n=1 Tax=Streptomyces diacarni TaxID=2800381 RepID=UPI0033E14109